ncbi:MAG: redoxin domain-containing protein [Sulfurimonas sp.]|uniref:redoxin domain-containing protein n=1 Tax=Sulfurimonas sp. TaxID=2022749 RepID=UPI0025CE120E|nr:redoxin domain-containing protein [Sulfurimonas sp.]MCK9492507.1 redoxin domain-containing protein [Sulfurimonas sp.]
MTKSLIIKQKLKKYIKEIALFILIMTVIANVISFYKSMDLNKQKLQEMSVTLLDKTSYTHPKDKPILIHFWATWCPTCKLEASNIQSISKDYEVLTIAVNSGSNEEIKEYMSKNSFDFKVYSDESVFFAKEFKIAAYPTTFIYDKDKNLIFSEVGFTSTLGLYFRMWIADKF